MNNGTNNFYNDLNLVYPEIAILLEDTYDNINRIGKFFIPILTPTLSKDYVYDQKELNMNSTDNIINDRSDLYIEECTVSNYIELKIPSHIKGKCKKDDKFVIVFIGGDINKPYIIGRYEE